MGFYNIPLSLAIKAYGYCQPIMTFIPRSRQYLEKDAESLIQEGIK
jgi:hypothetical protein